jgi:hypothetical protein
VKQEEDEDTSVFEAENTRLYQRVADFRRRYRRYVSSLPPFLPPSLNLSLPPSLSSFLAPPVSKL